jgi:hypothetical protein
LLHPIASEGNRPTKEELGMAKREIVLRARKRRDRSRDDDSMLLRSAESLGRVIGALQRQLDGATRRLTRSGGDGLAAPRRPPTARKGAATTRKRSAATKAKSIKKR